MQVQIGFGHGSHAGSYLNLIERSYSRPVFHRISYPARPRRRGLIPRCTPAPESSWTLEAAIASQESHRCLLPPESHRQKGW